MPKPKFIIKNPAQLQVFTTLYSGALIGVITANGGPGHNYAASTLAERADEIAIAAAILFQSHFPTEADIEEVEGAGDKIVVPIGTGKNPEGEK